MAEYKAKAVSAEQFQKEHGRPLVLQFQPDTFRVLKEPEDLRQWEAEVKERSGLGHLNFSAMAETCTESGNPSNDCDTD